jgi:acetyl-CoA carboxylase biotin carboxyl carrier protein
VPDLSFTEVGEILQLLQGVEGSDVELEWGDLRLHVRRSSHGTLTASDEASDLGSDVTALARANESPAASSKGTVPHAAPQPAVPAASESSADIPDHWVAVSAPMAGTFYRSPKPDEPPYVEVGDLVSEGDTVAIVEVMKLFTELKAEAAGKVARIDVADGAMIEFGQALVWIEPA